MRVRPPFKSILTMFTPSQRDDWTLPMTRQMGFEPDSSFLNDSVDELLAELRGLGVVRALVPGNVAVAPESAGSGGIENVLDEDTLELTRMADGVFVGAFAVDPNQPSTAGGAERAV